MGVATPPFLMPPTMLMKLQIHTHLKEELRKQFTRELEAQLIGDITQSLDRTLYREMRQADKAQFNNFIVCLFDSLHEHFQRD